MTAKPSNTAATQHQPTAPLTQGQLGWDNQDRAAEQATAPADTVCRCSLAFGIHYAH